MATTTKRIRTAHPALVALGPLLLIAIVQAAQSARQAQSPSAPLSVSAQQANPVAQQGTTPQQPNPAPGLLSTATLRVVTDATGRRVEVPVRARRVVSLAPNVTDILYALGAGPRIVGITDFTIVPSGTAPKPSVGDPLEPSLEKIVSLKPDLVLVSKTINRLETVESLDRLGIPVYATDARTVQGMVATVGRVAGLVGRKQAGEALQSRLEERLQALRARLAGRKPKRVLFVVWQDPLITTGQNTFLADALRWAGAVSVVKVRQDWPHISLEEVVHLQPQDLIFPATNGATPGDIRHALLGLPGWKELKAVQQGRVLVVGDAINRPSPRLVTAIEQLARELHPAAFIGNDAPNQQAPRKRQRARRAAATKPTALVAASASYSNAGGKPCPR